MNKALSNLLLFLEKSLFFLHDFSNVGDVKRFSFIAFFFWGLSNLFASPGRLDPSFTPTPPPNGNVHALHLHPDGGIIIGGEFTEPRAYLAKYNANGILDTSFSPTLDGPVYALEIISSFDLILVGGSFENLNGTPSKSFGGIKLDGTLHQNSQYVYDSGFDGPVHAIQFQFINSSASLLVGGEFSFFQGRPSNNLAGFWVGSFPNSIIFQIDYRLNGKVNTISRTSGFMGRYVGGTFTRAGINILQNCALITGTSARSPNFHVQDEVFAIQPYSRNPAGPLQVEFLILGGAFTAFTGQPVPAPGIGLLTSGVANYNFPPNDFSNATSLFLDSEDNLLAGSNTGEFWRFIVSDPSRFAPPSTTTSFYHPSLANGKISAIEQEEFDRYYIIGEFTEVDGQSRPYFARLHGPIGSEVPDAPSISNIIVTDDRALVEITIDQGILAYQIEYRSHEGVDWFAQPETASSFAYLTGLLPAQTYEVRARTRNVNGWSVWGSMTLFQSEAKLGNSGLVLPSFVPLNPVQAFDQDFQLDADGNLLLRGAFQEGEETKIGVVSISPKFEVSFFVESNVFPNFVDDFRPDPRGGIIARNRSTSFFRVDENGEVDPSFNAELIPNSSGRDFSVQSDGKVILVDPREDNNGATFIPLARLNADGSRDSSFDPVFTNGANIGTVEKIILLPDDSIFVFGNFDAVDGIPAGEVVKLTLEGEVDSSFQLAPETSSFWNFNDASVDSTGRLLLAGVFQDASEGGQVNLTRLTRSGDIDPTFPELVFSNFSGDFIELQADGKIIAASSSSDNDFEVNGIPVSGIFRLTPDGELDPNFNLGLGIRRDTSFSTLIRSIKSLPNGTIVVGGLFDRCNGQACDGFALLRGDENPSDYELWLQAYGLPLESDPTANPDGDSFNLAFEFAYNLSPLLKDSTNSLQAIGERARISPPLQRGVSVSAFFSPDLQTWQEIVPSSDWTLEAPSEFKGLGGYFRFSIDSTN